MLGYVMSISQAKQMTGRKVVHTDEHQQFEETVVGVCSVKELICLVRSTLYITGDFSIFKKYVFEIKQVVQCTFLGVVVDHNFTWKPHIQHVVNKISKGIGILNRAKRFLFYESLLTLYNSLLKPHFTYCLTSWGSTTKSRLKGRTS